MTAIISFIGWHESGKTTLAAGVVAHLHRKGLRVAVIKPSDKRGISFDTPDTDTSVHRRAGAAEVMLVAPDLDISFDYVFRLNEAAEIAEFIQKRFIDNEKRRPDKTALLVNGRKIVLKRFIQDSLAGVVAGCVESLKLSEEVEEIELRIKL